MFSEQAAFTFASNEKKTTIIFAIGPKPVQNPGTAISVTYRIGFLFRFDNKIPHAEKGRCEHERKVNDAAKCCKMSEVFTLVK